MQVAAATPLKPHNGTFRKGTQEQREPKMISPLLVLSFLLLPTSFVSSDVAFPLQVNLWFSQRKEQTRNFQTSKTYEKMWTNQYICWKPGHINQTYLCCKAGHIYQYLNTTTRLAARHICQFSPIRLVKLVDVWWRSMPPERELSLPVSTGALIS